MCSYKELSYPNLHNDRRKYRTRRLLRKALFELMLEKGYEAITIEDITQRSDLGRTTFYLHYKDKEELLLESIKTVAEELKEQILSELEKENAPSKREAVDIAPGQKVIQMIMEHIAANASLYLPILRGEGTPYAPAYIRQIIYQGAIEFFSDNKTLGNISEKSSYSIEILATFFSSSLMGIMTWWLENNMRLSPEEMANIYRHLLRSGIGVYH